MLKRRAAASANGRSGPSAGAVARAMLGGLADVCFPPTCVLCHGPLDAGTLCGECLQLLRSAAAGRTCARCGRAIPAIGNGAAASGNEAAGIDDWTLCAGCRREPGAIERVYVLGMYRDVLREAVLAAKRPAYAPLALALGDLLGQHLRDHWSGGPIAGVTYIPSHWTRRLRRGGGCTQLIARQVARRLNVPLIGMIRAVRRTEKQGTLSDVERRTNVLGAFSVKKGYALAVPRVLVVDDVWTTGATLREAARVIRQGYDADVVAAVVARAIGVHHG